MANGDYYEILGVAKSAGADEIKKAFRKKAAELHPDNQDTGNESKFKELVAAYEVLSDENKKTLYDRYGEDGLKRGGAGAGAGYGQDFDMSAFSDLGEIFEYFFGGGMRASGRRPGATRGSDLRYDMELDFLEAVFGVEKKINIKHLRHCKTCNGTGGAAGSNPVTCTACGGHGQVRQTTSTLFGQFSQITTCPHCEGEGSKVEKPCDDCKGKGLLRQERSLELKIPAGVDTGSRIRVSGEGDSAKRGAGTGDLYVIVHVRQHEKFIREGTTIHLKQAISMSMAALGAEMVIDTVGGKRLLKVPVGTKAGTVIVMRSEGVPYLSNSEKRGDQLVHLLIETPLKLSEEEKELYKKLAELRGEKLSVPESEKPQ
ncbi:MAG: molecular chaperone DnaJ, partial [Candidatus Obscuribacterales bacterium]|nr:molecular chaperone DnaJ [Candidatus Obscuribacterales bacterium]